MEKSLASVGCPTRRELLFEDKPDVLGPDVGLGAQHDLDFERDKDRRTYLEVLADQPHGVEVVCDRLSQFVRELVCANRIDRHAHCPPASGPRVTSRGAGNALDLLCSRDIVGKRHGAKLPVSIGLGDAANYVSDGFAVDAVGNVERIPTSSQRQSRSGRICRYR